LTIGSTPVNSALTIAGGSVSATNLPSSRKSVPLYATWLLSLGIAGLAFMGIPQRGRSARALAICAVIGLGMVATSCAGVSSGAKATPTPTPTPTPVTYAVTINGSAGSSQFSTTVNVIVQ
jgi:peptidoglycan/LPS O-acetylase OafA/YrhL